MTITRVSGDRAGSADVRGSRIRTFKRPHVVLVRTLIFGFAIAADARVGQFRQRLARACSRAMISARTAERRALPASSRSGLSTNSTVRGTL